ncbi:MAG: response regulator [Actinomycetota bacterium]
MLLDLGLPDSDGLETIAALRAADPDVPIIVVSGTAGEADRRLAVRLGVDDVVGKDQLETRPHPLGHSIRNAVDRPARKPRRERR